MIQSLLWSALIFAVYLLLPLVRRGKVQVVRVIVVGLLHIWLNVYFCMWVLYRYYLRDEMSGQALCLIAILHIIGHIIYIVYCYKKQLVKSLYIVITLLVMAYVYFEWPLWALSEDEVKVYVYSPMDHLGDTNVYALVASSYMMPKHYELEDEIVIFEQPLENMWRYPANPRGLLLYQVGGRDSFDDSYEVAEDLLSDKVRKDVTLQSRAQFTERDVSGSSGGLAFYLSGLVQEELVHNSYKVGATGEIDEEGNVHSVAFVYVKTLGAIMNDLDYVIVPKEDEEEALRAVKDKKSTLQVITVSTVAEAEQFLMEVNN